MPDKTYPKNREEVKNETENFEVVTEEIPGLTEALLGKKANPEENDDNNSVTENRPVDETEKTSGEETDDTEEKEEDTKNEETKDEEEKDKKPRKRKSNAEKRIKKLIGEKYALIKQLEELKEKLEKLEKSSQNTEKEERETKEKIKEYVDDSMPVPEQFQTYDEYLEAFETWQEEKEKAEEVIAEDSKETKPVEDTEEKEFEKLVNNAILEFNKKVEELGDELPKDFYERISDQRVPLNAYITIALSNVDNPVETAYYLAKNPEKTFKIAKLNDMNKVLVEVGKISAKVEGFSDIIMKNQKKITKAGEPITPVKEKSDGVEVDLANAPFEVYEKIVNEREKKKHKDFW